MKALVYGLSACIYAASTATIAGTIVLNEGGTQVASCSVTSSTIDGNGNITATVTSCTMANPPDPVAGPDLVVSGPSGALADGSGVQSFGTDTVDGTSLPAQTFTMYNNGDEVLSGIAVSIGGTHPSNFSLSASPPSTIAAGTTATFQVQFGATAAGTRSATLSITNNIASTKNPYSFALTGTGEDSGSVPTGGDPGTALYVPSANLFVVDQSTANGLPDTTTYAPGCVNGRDILRTHCEFDDRVTDNYAGNSYTIAANANQTISIRYRPTNTVGSGWFYPTRLTVNGQTGGNIGRDVVASLSTTPGDFSMPAGPCKYESQGESASILIGSNHCAINAGTEVYYLNIKPLEACSGLDCIFKVVNSAYQDLQ